MTNTSEGRRLGLKIWGPMAITFAVACVLIWRFVPAPLPESITLATGEGHGHYATFGLALKERMAERGVRVELVPSTGSAANIELLMKGKVDIALVQSGDFTPLEAAALTSVCSVFYEPCFVFQRAGMEEDEIAGARIAAGVPGSGTRQLIERLLGDSGIADGDAAGTQMLDLGGPAAVEALRKGEVDMAAFVTAPGVAWLRPLFSDASVRIRPFRRATAITRHYRYLTELVIPEGLIDLMNALPAADVPVIATTASVVARPDIHDGLISLLIESCRDELEDGDLLAGPDVFPSDVGVHAPLHRDAVHYFRHGPSFLQRWLPSQMAFTIARLALVILPLLTLLYPLLKGAGPLIRWIVQRRVFRWYRVLRALEAEMDAVADDPDAMAEVREHLVRVGEEIRHTHVPARYAADLFHLRQHHRMLVERLDE